jgi:hypothetical protein
VPGHWTAVAHHRGGFPTSVASDERRAEPFTVDRGSPPGVLMGALILAGVAGCQRPALAALDAVAHSSGRQPGQVASTPPSPDARAAGGSPAAPDASPGYPVDTRPPKDFFSDRLLRTLAHEASAVVVCRLSSLTDALPQYLDPDVFYDAACEVLEVITGSPEAKPIHFIWQVERGSHMPPPGAELLVYLKPRKEPLDGPPALKWVALDTGVMRYTPALRDRVHRQPKKK